MIYGNFASVRTQLFRKVFLIKERKEMYPFAPSADR